MNWTKMILALVVSAVFVVIIIVLGIAPGHIDNAGLKLPKNPTGKYVDWKIDGTTGTVADFTRAAAYATPAVVHIITRGKQEQADDDNRFTNPGVEREMRGSGSGVILSSDGYIVTNNHLIRGANEIKVTLPNQRSSYVATLIGADPESDIAVVKISAANLPFLLYGNSDLIHVGQWVLAIGYPFELEETVTAGIISATERPLVMRKNDQRNESFIQTDAAINFGNSGGALVNLNGEVVGLNTALTSPTGAYSGYGYAIPMNKVRTIVNDLIRYGKTNFQNKK